MDLIERGRQVLIQAEMLLRAVIADAATTGEPEELGLLVGWLHDLQQVVTASAAPTGRADVAPQSNRTAVVPQSSPPRIKKGDYPKFFRQGELILKVGYSKKSRAEYEHKAPRPAVAAMVPALVKAGTNRKRFTVDDLTPIKTANGTEVPDYQLYLAIGWLKSCGLIVQHGRQGYSLTRTPDLGAAVEAAWTQLAER